MKLSIMQPYFFPYLGYFQLINHSDQFIFFDTVQYNKKSWMNRNRLLHPTELYGFQYISVPVVKHEKGSLIKDVLIANDGKWQHKILGQLTLYKKLQAPHYQAVKQIIEEIIFSDYTSLSDLTIASIKAVCDYIGISLNYEIASQLNFNASNIRGAGDWSLELSKQKSASEYINPPSGYGIFDENKFNERDIKLKFLKSNLSPYQQSRRPDFNSALSILDVLMFNDLDAAKSIIQYDCKILTQSELILDNEKMP